MPSNFVPQNNEMARAEMQVRSLIPYVTEERLKAILRAHILSHVYLLEDASYIIRKFEGSAMTWDDIFLALRDLRQGEGIIFSTFVSRLHDLSAIERISPRLFRISSQLNDIHHYVHDMYRKIEEGAKDMLVSMREFEYFYTSILLMTEEGSRYAASFYSKSLIPSNKAFQNAQVLGKYYKNGSSVEIFWQDMMYAIHTHTRLDLVIIKDMATFNDTFRDDIKVNRVISNAQMERMLEIRHLLIARSLSSGNKLQRLDICSTSDLFSLTLSFIFLLQETQSSIASSDLPKNIYRCVFLPNMHTLNVRDIIINNKYSYLANNEFIQHMFVALIRHSPSLRRLNHYFDWYDEEKYYLRHEDEQEHNLHYHYRNRGGYRTPDFYLPIRSLNLHLNILRDMRELFSWIPRLEILRMSLMTPYSYNFNEDQLKWSPITTGEFDNQVRIKMVRNMFSNTAYKSNSIRYVLLSFGMLNEMYKGHDIDKKVMKNIIDSGEPVPFKLHAEAMDAMIGTHLQDYGLHDVFDSQSLIRAKIELVITDEHNYADVLKYASGMTVPLPHQDIMRKFETTYKWIIDYFGYGWAYLFRQIYEQRGIRDVLFAGVVVDNHNVFIRKGLGKDDLTLMLGWKIVTFQVLNYVFNIALKHRDTYKRPRE